MKHENFEKGLNIATVTTKLTEKTKNIKNNDLLNIGDECIFWISAPN